MTSVLRVVTRDDLDGVARAAFPARRLVGVSRVRGGTKKGVYRLFLDDDRTAIAYVWADEENYWPGGHAVTPADAYADPFSHASGLALFSAAGAELDAAGVRTPAVYLTDDSGRHYPADVAVVEDVPGGDLLTLLEQQSPLGATVVDRLGGALDAMYQRLAPRYGKVALIRAGGVSVGSSCEQVVAERALTDLDEAAWREPRIGPAKSKIAALLDKLAARVRPRGQYRLIHGELGPEHVLYDRSGSPALIDLEGLMYFDIEWEHVFLRLRYGSYYRRLARADLDQRRMALYELAMRLSLVAGPLRILDGDFPDREGMLEIADYNTRATLDLLND
jgi:Phosphotransferase enzyme family